MFLLSLYNILIPILGMAWLVPSEAFFFVLAALYYIGRVRVHVFRWFFIALVVLLLLRAALRILFQYVLFRSSLQGTYLLPPHAPMSYFLGYSFTHHLAWMLLTFASVFVIAAVLYGFSRLKRTQGRRLWQDGEEFLFLNLMLLAGWPLVLPYVAAGLIFAVLISGVRTGMFRNQSPLNILPAFLLLLPVVALFRAAIISFFGLTPLVMPM